MVGGLGVEAGKAPAGEARCRDSFADAEGAEDVSQDVLDVRGADDFAHGVEGFAERTAASSGGAVFCSSAAAWCRAFGGARGGRPGGGR